MQYKYAILNIVIYNILSQNQRGVSGALGIQQPYPYPPNDKMKPLLFFLLMTTHHCQLCGKPYTKKYRNQRYCSEDCSKEAPRLKNRIYFSKRYTKNKTYCWARKKGTGTLGPHRHDNDESEYEAIQTELRRLRLR